MDEAKAKILGDFYTLRAGISYISREKSRAQKLIKKNGDYIQKEREELYALPAAKYDEVKEVLNKAESSKMSCEQTCRLFENAAQKHKNAFMEDYGYTQKKEKKQKTMRVVWLIITALALAITAFGFYCWITMIINYFRDYPIDFDSSLHWYYLGWLISTGIMAFGICGLIGSFFDLTDDVFYGFLGGGILIFIGLIAWICISYKIVERNIIVHLFFAALGCLAICGLLIWKSVICFKRYNHIKECSKHDLEENKAEADNIRIFSAQYKTAVENANKNTEETYKAVIPAVQTCQTLYNALVEQYSSLLDVRDWEFLDFFIYYFETNRVDTVREALLLADNERRADRIVQAVQSAAREISHTLNRGFEALGSQISLSFSALSDRIDNLAHGINKISGGLNAINGNLITMGAMNSALMAKANTDSRQLMDDVHQMRVLADSAEVRRRTT